MAADASIMLNIAKAGLKEKLTDIYSQLEMPEKLPLNIFSQILNKADKSEDKHISRDLAAARILQAMKFDKKFSSKSNKFIMLKDIGRPVFVYNPDKDILIEAIKNNITGE
jgi:3-dehydroquinate synthetase